jgi:uncharacterized protein
VMTTMADKPAGNDCVGELERMYTSGQVEIRSGVGGRTIGGYAAVFGQMSRDLGFGNEVVGRTFFEESRRAGFPDVVARWDHETHLLLGATNSGTLRLSVDGTGLDYSVDLPECRSDLLELIARRDITSSSFAFEASSDDWSFRGSRPLRTLLAGTLHDVAPVSISSRAAYPAATVALRSLARWVDAPIEDVEMRARSGELAGFFERSDNRGAVPASTLKVMARTEASRRSASGRRLLTGLEALDRTQRNRYPTPRYVVQQQSRERSLRLHAKRIGGGW